MRIYQSGEARFRELERGVLLSALEKRPAPVVALGGGSLVDPVSRQIAFERAVIIGLSASRDTLLARLGQSDRKSVV